MLKVFGANVVVSKNFDDEANPIRELADGKIVSFRIGDKKYDSRAENESRWINVTVKASGTMAERVKKMKLKTGSMLIIDGELDIEKWTNDDDELRMDTVIWLTGITYQYTGGDKKEEENSSNKAKKGTSEKKKEKKTPSFEEYDENDEEDEETKKKSKKKPSKEDYEEEDDGYNPFD